MLKPTKLRHLSREFNDNPSEYSKRHDKEFLQYGNSQPHAAKVAKSHFRE